jgi:cytosine/adenosine deaminase-related metal-dependent hydrolase
MKKQAIIPKEIVTVNSEDEILRNHFVEIVDGKISSIESLDKFDADNFNGEVVRAEDLTLIPGFVQTHVHLCQTLFRGMADDLELLDWLQYRIFPYENAHDKKSLSASVKLGLYELQKGGTTTILDMGTVNHQEIIFEDLIDSGIRAFAGKCMIDRNDLFPDFRESREESMRSTLELARSFHGANGEKIHYGFAPRFALSCTTGLLKDIEEAISDFSGSLYHTHSSENKDEIAEVRKIAGMENIEYFNSIGVLNENTVLAHCIHLNENEVSLMKNSKAAISHCPSSNLKLASGIADIPRYLKEGIKVSLGADGAPCNNSLSIFTEMRLASLMQKPIHGASEMDAKRMLRLATIDGGRALNMESKIGSIETGKFADLVLLNLNKPDNSMQETDESIYSDIVYSSTSENVTDVMVEGEWVVRNSEHVNYEKFELVSEGKSELNSLLSRIS